MQGWVICTHAETIEDREATREDQVAGRKKGRKVGRWNWQKKKERKKEEEKRKNNRWRIK